MYCRDLLHHQRIGLRRDVPAAEMLGQRDDAERDRHPGLDARRGVVLRPGRVRSAPVRSIRRRYRTGWRRARADRAAASSRSRQASPRSRGRSPRAGCRSRPPPGRENCRHCRPRGRLRSRSAAAAWRFSHWILSRQMLKRGDGALDRGLADAAGRGDALAEPDDPREGIDHAKTVAGRTGDQQPAIVGAEIERGIDAGTLTGDAAPAPAAAAADPGGPSRGAKAIAKPRVIVHQNVFPRPVPADEEFPFTETLAAQARRRNSRAHGTMPNQALSSGFGCVI